MVKLHISDCLNIATQEGIPQTLKAFNLPPEAATVLGDWLAAQDRVLELEDQIELATRIADQIVDEKLQPMFANAMEVEG
jgi:hypothetical protein